MRINQLKAGVILSYLSVALGALVSIIYTPAMLRLLGQSEYGLYTLAGSTVSYLSLLNFGFSSSYIRYYNIYKVEKNQNAIAKLNGMYLTVFTVIGLIAVLAGSVLVMNTNKIFRSKLTADEIVVTKALMTLLVINVGVSFPFSIFSTYITANEQYFFQRVLNLAKVVANPFLSLLALMLGFRSIGMVCVTVSLNILIDILHFAFCIRKLKMEFAFSKFDRHLFKDIAAFSSFIFINIIVDQVNWNVDKFLLGVFQGSKATAIYGLSAQLNGYYQQLSSIISSVFIPRVHFLISNKRSEDIKQLFIKVGRIQFMILALICSGFVFFGHPFILKWGGNTYGDSYYITLLLIIPSTVPLIQNLGIEILRARNLHQFRSYVYLGIAVLNVLLSIPLCKLFSGVGCAVGTAVSLVVGNIVIMNIYYHKKCGIDILKFWKNIAQVLPAMIIPIIFGVILKQFLNVYVLEYLVIAIAFYTVVYALSIWFMGMNCYEKNLITSPIKRIMLRYAR